MLIHAVLFGLIVCSWGQSDHLRPQEYASEQEIKEALGVEFKVVAEGEGSIYNPCYGDPTSDECEAYKLKEKTPPTRSPDYSQQLSSNTKQAKSDIDAYSAIVSMFEHRTNDWCCGVTGKPLYTVSGDRDVLNYIYYFLTQVFDYNGQSYAGRLVLQFHRNRDDDAVSYHCDAAPLGDQQTFGAPIDAILGLRETLSAWMMKNEVNPKRVINGFLPQARKLYGKFLRSRMLFTNSSTARSEAAIIAVLPIVERTDHLECCEAAGEFSSLVGTTVSPKLKAQLDDMLRACIDNGKLAKNPAEYGEVLLNSGREHDARVLFDLAVERGALCNPWQRPSSLHRKDLPAAAIWPLYKLPGVKKAFATLAPVIKSAIAQGALDSIPERGNHTRTPLFSRIGVNQSLCEIAGDAGCGEVLRAAHTILSSNDGYEIACNGSLTIELWKIKAHHSIPRELGATNIVLQAVQPLNGQSLTLQVGEDSMLVDGDFSEPIVFDDSFEHVISVDGATDAYFLHAQVCHPSMHDKVLDVPTNECAEFDDEE